MWNRGPVSLSPSVRAGLPSEADPEPGWGQRAPEAEPGPHPVALGFRSTGCLLDPSSALSKAHSSGQLISAGHCNCLGQHSCSWVLNSGAFVSEKASGSRD